MLATFNQAVHQADGRFLSDSELQELESYIQSFSARSQAYKFLSDNADTLVIQSLRQLARTHRQEVQSHSAKCRRDMSYALKEIAKAVLMDESEAFKQEFSLWMENITRAVHKGDSAARAYACLKEELKKSMPPQSVNLVVPYVDELIQAFSGQ